MNPTPHIFISFKTEERDFAVRLKTVLTESGFRVWWQEEIQCGQEWHGEIDKAIEEAAAIIVLWSKRSMSSSWVKHEASQAISKRMYAPVRIEMLEIESPFNRIQATDMFNWAGDTSHPGYQNLMVRLKELVPEPVPFAKRVVRFIWKERIAAVLFLITTAALYLLVTQSYVLNDQMKKQDHLLLNVQQTDRLLQTTKDSLDRQFRKITELNRLMDGNLTQTSHSIQDQFERASTGQQQLKAITDKIQNTTGSTIVSLNSAVNSLAGLDSSQRKVLTNIRRSLYPIDVDKMAISYQVYWDVNNTYLKQYVSKVLTFAREQRKKINVQSFVRLNNQPASYSDSIVNYKFDKENVLVSYQLNADSSVTIRGVQIKDNSPLMPDCNGENFYERMVADYVCSQRIYIDFSKNYDGTRSFFDQEVLRLISFTENKNCKGRKAYNDMPVAGNSDIEVNLQFDQDTLSYCSVKYKTNKIISDINTGRLLSVIDLLDADLRINSTSYEFKITQLGDIVINTSGELNGGIRISAHKSFPKEQPGDFNAMFKLDKGCFNANIFNQ
jgi:hypothetical protein